MSINLYFIGNCKDFMTYPTFRSLSYGWGINKNGGIRRPNENPTATPIVIDDSIALPVSAESLTELADCCGYGCILDFERQYSPFHAALISVLQKARVGPIWIPANYTKHCPEAIPLVLTELPHNSWKNYCISLERTYHTGWALEYHPVRISKPSSASSCSARRVLLRNALCITESNNGQIHYFDTVETIMEKIRIAEQYGCKGIIAIADEWKALRKK